MKKRKNDRQCGFASRNEHGDRERCMQMGEDVTWQHWHNGALKTAKRKRCSRHANRRGHAT